MKTGTLLKIFIFCLLSFLNVISVAPATAAVKETFVCTMTQKAYCTPSGCNMKAAGFQLTVNIENYLETQRGETSKTEDKVSICGGYNKSLSECHTIEVKWSDSIIRDTIADFSKQEDSSSSKYWLLLDTTSKTPKLWTTGPLMGGVSHLFGECSYSRAVTIK